MLTTFIQRWTTKPPQTDLPFCLPCRDPDLSLDDVRLPMTISLVEMNKVLPKWKENASRLSNDDLCTESHRNAQHVDDARREQAQKGITPEAYDQNFWPGANFIELSSPTPIKRGLLRRLWDILKHLFKP